MTRSLLLAGVLLLVLFFTWIGLAFVDPAGLVADQQQRRVIVRQIRLVIDHLEQKYKGRPLAEWDQQDRNNYHSAQKLLAKFSD